MKNNKGSAMVIILALTSILFLGCMFLVKVAKESVHTAQCMMDKLQAQMNAESAVEDFKFLGATGSFSFNTLVNDICRQIRPPTEASKEETLKAEGKALGIHATEHQWEIPLDGTPFEIAKGVRLRALDAGAKLSAWGLNSRVLKQLLSQAGADEATVRVIEDSLLDWIDDDDLKRLNGAESHYYQWELGAKFTPRNAPAPQHIGELSLIKGLNDPAIWAKIKDEMILISNARLNLNTMDRKLMAATLEISSGMAEKLIKLRQTNGHLTYFDVYNVTGIDSESLLDSYGANIYPTRVVSLTVEAICGETREVLRCDLDLEPDQFSPYRILEFIY